MIPAERGPSIVIVVDGHGDVAGRAAPSVRNREVWRRWNDTDLLNFLWQDPSQSSQAFVRGSVFFVAANAGGLEKGCAAPF